MRTNINISAQLGELITAAFDEAACFSADPHEISRLATSAVLIILQRAPRRRRALPVSCPQDREGAVLTSQHQGLVRI